MNNYAKDFVQELKSYGYLCNLINDYKKVSTGDLLILLSCENIFKNLILINLILLFINDLPLGRS